MATLRGKAILLRCLLLWALSISAFATGLSQSLCKMKLDFRDFDVVLKWDCPTLPFNTTFTIQTKTQGDRNWRGVTGCVRVTSRTCSLSEAFEHLALYNMVRLETEVTPGRLHRMTPVKVDLLSHMVFSPPSLSLSLKQSVLTVKVQFPTSLNRRLCPHQSNCSIPVVLERMTTIVVYKRKRPSECQTRTLRAVGDTLSCDFENLEAGQEYCAVANFTSSSSSSPSCIYTPFQHPVLKPLLIVLGVCCVLLASTTVFLKAKRVSSERRCLPKTLESLQDELSRELWVLQEDCEGDHLSILSLSSSYDSIPPLASEALTDHQILDNGYHNNPFLVDSDSGESDWGSRGMTDLAGPGHGANAVSWLCDRIAAQSQQSNGTSPPSDGHWGVSVRVRSPLMSRDVPLGSVRLASAEAEALEEWSHLSQPVESWDPGISNV
ncbi:uncharacterized protein LOC108932920 [Scleropages formosus]|uniref:uncharacterized protein LOC108932920 n=1 Tax=Scleropages formosus TaxID=113540 RepID=UPI0010FA9615|nr:uncharacterized protein LOC108932920 [Scleropages formosus]